MTDASVTVAVQCAAGGVSLLGGAGLLPLLAETSAQHQVLPVRGLEGLL